MRADTTRWAGLTMVLLLSMACSAPAGAPGQTSDDARVPTPQTFVQVPQGFAVSVFAEGLSGVRMLELGPDDRLYAVRSSDGEIVRFELNADGTARGGPEVVVSGGPRPQGFRVDRARRGTRSSVAGVDTEPADPRGTASFGGSFSPGRLHRHRPAGSGKICRAMAAE